MMQATSHSVQPTEGVDQSLEGQNRPEVHVERIDPSILHFICFLFPCQFEGMKFLTLLCRRATEKQLAMFKEHVAVITFHGIATLCASPEWPWGYHATLRYFILFEALGILTRLRTHRTTEVRIPLGTRGEPLNREQLLKSLGDLQKNTPKKREYKDKKLVQLIERVKKHIEVYGIDTSGDSESEQFDQLPLLPMQERLIEVMRSEHIPLAKCKRIAQWMCASQVPQLLRDYMRTAQEPREGHPSEQQGDSEAFAEKAGRRYQCRLGDSEVKIPSTDIYQGGDSAYTLGDSQNRIPALPEGTHFLLTAQNRPETVEDDLHSGLSTLSESSTSPEFAPGEADDNEMGDSERSLSSNISLLNKVITHKDDIVIDTGKAAPLALESPCSEKSLLAEATWIAGELDGKESLKKNGGRGWVGAYKRKLQEHPYLVRASLIDMFMQHVFPDWRGKPHGRGGQWFNKCYKAYALQEEPVPAEIESWARSPYSYVQIKKALFLERRRQEEELRGDSLRTFTRPFADCVEIYGLLRRSEVSTPPSEVYEDLSDEEGLDELSGVPAGEREHVAGVEMEDGTLLSTEQYEQLHALACEEEERRVKALIADRSEAADEMIRVYAEQWVAISLSSLPSAVLTDLEQLRAILSPECYTVKMQLLSGGSCVIAAQSRDDLDNVCLLDDPDQTQRFIHRFNHLPMTVYNDLQQLSAVLDPELCKAEVLLAADGPFMIKVRASTNPRNACLIEGPAQTQAFIEWLMQLPAAVLSDLQQLRALLDPELYRAEVLLTAGGPYVIKVQAIDDPSNARLIKGPDQALEFMYWLTDASEADH